MAAKKAKKAKKPQELTRDACRRMALALGSLLVKGGKWRRKPIDPTTPAPTLDDAEGSHAQLLELYKARVSAMHPDDAAICALGWVELRKEASAAAEALVDVVRKHGLAVDTAPLSELAFAMRLHPDREPDPAGWQAINVAAARTEQVASTIPANGKPVVRFDAVDEAVVRELGKHSDPMRFRDLLRAVRDRCEQCASDPTAFAKRLRKLRRMSPPRIARFGQGLYGLPNAQ